jgi:GNAT superfamily N-acetyltransferase
MPIRRAALADAAELTQLVNSAYRGESSKRGWTTESDLISGQRIDEELMSRYLTDPNVIVLKHLNSEDVITACVYLERKGSTLYLGMLTVSPDLQGQGIGAALLAEADHYAKLWSCASVMMTVITVRHELISYYERRGFYQTGDIVPFHMDERFGRPNQPIELLVMQRPVK